MPLDKGGRYRMKPMKGGGFERLHFTKSGAVNETKNMKTGATHTPSEFARDRSRAAKRKGR